MGTGTERRDFDTSERSAPMCSGPFGGRFCELTSHGQRVAKARPESFATRLVGALGYYVAPTWFLARGRITGVPTQRRAKLSGFARRFWSDHLGNWTALRVRRLRRELRKEFPGP